MFNLIDDKTGFKIDFIVFKKTEYDKIAFNRRKEIFEFGNHIWVITPEDLIIAKIIWIQDYQSEIQIIDIKNLLQIENIELDYIISWCKKLNLKTFNLIV